MKAENLDAASWGGDKQVYKAEMLYHCQQQAFRPVAEKGN
jgi:hypothetical protein